MNIKKLSQIILAIALVVASTQFSFAQKKSAAPTKNQLVNKLVDLTILEFPSEQYKKPLQEAEEKLVEPLKNEFTKMFAESLEKDNKFSAEQKARMKEHLPELGEDLSKQFLAKLQIALSNNLMIKDSMVEAYQKYSVAELKQIIAFIKTPAGKEYVSFLGKLSVHVLEESKNPDPEPAAKYAVKIEKFSKTPAGEKFLSTFAGDISTIFLAKVNSLLETYTENLDKRDFEATILNFQNKYSN